VILLAVAAVTFSGLLVPGSVASASARPAAGADRGSSAGTATLTVAVADLPPKTAGSVRVTGPRGYGKTVTVTTRLSGLLPGKYAIAGSPVVVKGTTYVPTVTGATQNLLAQGKATSTAAYLTLVPATTVGLAASAVASVVVKGSTETITLTASAAVKAGDVIVVDAGPHTPDGLLAKVTTVQGLVVTAVPASLQQAIPRGEFTTSAASGSVAARLASAGGTQRAVQTSFACGAQGMITATATPDVISRLTMTAQWGGPGGSRFDADLAVTGTIGVTASVSAGAKCDLEVSLKPLELAIQRIKILKLLKLVIRPDLEPYIKASVGTDAAETVSAALKLGGDVQLAYRDGNFHVIDRLTASTASYTPPHPDGTASVELTPGLRAGITVSLAGSVSANVDAGPRLDTAKGSLPAWVLDGLARAGLSIDLLGLKKSNEALVSKSFPITHPTTAALGELNRLTCPSAAVCWATGLRFLGTQSPSESVLLRSTDGGELWVPQPLPPGVSGPGAVTCPSVQRCYVTAAVGSQPVILDTSGGAPWTVTPVGGTDTTLSHIACATISHCVAVGDNAIAVTTDGGTQWITGTPPGRAQPLDVACPSVTVCYAAGADVDSAGDSSAAILRSANGGLSWAEIKIGITGLLGAISCPSVTHCVATGQGGSLFALVARTVNGGSWTHVELPDNNAIAAGNVTCPTTAECFAVGRVSQGLATGGGVLRSTDFGLNWTHEPIPGGANGLPLAIACQSSSHCEVVGGYKSNTPPFADLSAASTTNAGADWHTQLP
jgi:hypothetical protein